MMGIFVRCLTQSVLLTFLFFTGAHSDEATIDCSKLGSHLDPALLTGIYSEDIRSTGTALIPTENTSSLNRQSQLRAGRQIRLEPVITEDELYSCFGNHAREISWLRNSIDNQKKRFREIKDQKLARLYWTQDVIIGLGALATILLGLGSSGRWSVLKDFAIIPTALVTALSTFSAFQDYKGEVTRLGKAESNLSKLITEIDIRLLNISAQTSKIPFVVDADETRKWWDRADGIIKGVDDAWVIHISQSGSKN